MNDRTTSTGERRRESRFRVNIPAKIKGLEPVTSLGPSTAATVVDLSRGGLKLLAGRAYLPKSCVQVFAFHEILLGQVTHCSRYGAQFEVAVKLREVAADAATRQKPGFIARLIRRDDAYSCHTHD
jgi:hypothetical protein